VKKNRTKKLTLHRETLQRLALMSGTIMGGLSGGASCYDGGRGGTCLSDYGLCGVSNDASCAYSCAEGCTHTTCDRVSNYACCA
jgi:hypothetical protein